MKSIAFFTLLAATLVSAVPAPQTAGGPKFDPSGQKNVGNAKGLQFIGGQCLSTADCGSGCCAGPSGICSGVGAQFQAGKTGCGFPGAAGSASSSAAAAPTGAAGGANNAGSGSAAGAGAGAGSAAGAGASTTPANGGPNFDPSGAKNVGNAKGLQFIGGQCLAASDCGSGCCAGPSGICSGVGAQTQNGKTGCGFGDAGGNSSASTGAGAGGANNAGSGSAAGAGSATSGAGSAAGNGASTTPANGGPQFDPAGAKNFGNQKGAQFIGGQCKNAADCGSGCCAGPSGICSGVGAQTQNGKTGCGFGDAGKRSLLAGLLNL